MLVPFVVVMGFIVREFDGLSTVFLFLTGLVNYLELVDNPEDSSIMDPVEQRGMHTDPGH
jgi:hypothetical protein